jgi:hypothetical protein
MHNIVNLIVQTLQDAQQFFTYYTVKDSNVCEICDHYDDGSMTRREIRATFPYLIEYTETFWVPMVHPNCRCVLLFEETDEMVRPDKLSTEQLITRVETEVVEKRQGTLTPEEQKLPKPEQFLIIKKEVERLTHGLSPEDDEDDLLWDLIALGILETLQRTKQKEER